MKIPPSPRTAVIAAWTMCLSAPRSARATDRPRGVDLTWTAPAECPDPASAKRAVEGYLGGRPLEAFKPLAVQVELTGVGDGRFRAELAVFGPGGGSRRFEGATCARVTEAAALIVALMVDPVEVATQIESPRLPARPAVQALPQEGAKTAPLRGAIGLQTSGDVGSLPEPTVGVGIVAGLEWARTSLAIDVTSWVSRRVFGGPTAASGGEIGLSTASVRGCFAPFSEPLAGVRLDVCARGEGGLAHGRGFGIAEPGSSRPPWAAAFAGVTVRQSFPSALGVWLSVEGGVAVSRPRFFIEDFGRVFEASPVLGRALLGVAWTFP